MLDKYVEFEKAYILEPCVVNEGTHAEDFSFEEVEVAPRNYLGFTDEEKAEIRSKYPDVQFTMDKELDV